MSSSRAVQQWLWFPSSNQAIAGWLLNHIKKEDVKVAAHIRSKRQD